MPTPLSDSTIRVTIKPSHRPSVLAAVSIELQTDLGMIRFHDGRLLRNKAGQVWFSLATFSITVGKSYEYKPTIELSAALHQQVASAALAEFEKWERQEGSGFSGGAR